MQGVPEIPRKNRIKTSEFAEYGIIAAMSKMNSDETVPMKPKNKSDKTQPVGSGEPTIAQAVSTPKAGTGSRKKFAKEAGVVEEKGEVIPTPPEADIPPKKAKRGGWIALGILGMLLIVFAGVAIGYSSAIKVRKTEETTQRLVVATTQFELSQQNIKDGALDLAKRRLEYVIQVYPSFPGAADKLAEVLVSMAKANQNSGNTTTSVLPTVEATKDTRGAAAIFAQAQQQLAAQDWQNLYVSVSSLRDLDPTYEAVKVDDMYYLALRNVAINNIKAGNLEIGIYQFSVAEQIGPIDAEADGYRQWAKMYVNAGAYWATNWANAVAGFSQLYSIVPNMIDFNGITVKQRYAQALDGYGDAFEASNDWCDAVTQYNASINIINSQTVAAKIPQAKEYCANPPATPTPTPDPNLTPTPTNAPKK